MLVAGAGPRAGRPVQAAIDRHGPPDGGFTREVGPILLFQQPMQTKAPRPRVLLLQVQHLFEKRECQLVVGMGGGACPLVLEAFKPIPLKGRNDRIHVRTGHLETASNTLFVPSFVPHPDDGPAGLIGVRKLGKGQQVQLQLHGEGKALEEVFDGVVIGLIAEFPLHDAHDFAVMNGRIELFDIEDMRRNRPRDRHGPAVPGCRDVDRPGRACPAMAKRRAFAPTTVRSMPVCRLRSAMVSANSTIGRITS